MRVEAGRLTHFPGGYQYYLDKTAAAAPPAGAANCHGPRAAAAATGRTRADRKGQKRMEAEQRQARSGERKARQARLATLEAEIFNTGNPPEGIDRGAWKTRRSIGSRARPCGSTASGLQTPRRLEHLAREWEQAAEQVLAVE